MIEALLAEAACAAQEECCGLLFGEANRIETAFPARNVHSTPATHFEIDPAALISAHKAARGGGPRLAGYYHSHPSGPPEPSATDAARAHGDGRVWAIVARGEVAFWRDGPGGFEALSTQVVDG